MLIIIYKLWVVVILTPILTTHAAQRYLVNTDYCKIPDLDPLDKDVMEYFHRIKYTNCTKLTPLTQVDYDPETKHYILSINEKAFQHYLEIDLELRVPFPATLSCCYMEVERSSDQAVELSSCKSFKDKVELPNSCDSFIIQCYANGKRIYTNGHATVPERRKVRARLNQWAAADRKRGGIRAPSVLMIGIDTISRLNLIRAMPETWKYLKANDWFEMSGYNKVADNTLPNLVTLLTGYRLRRIVNECNPLFHDGLDKCEFIWNLYRDSGYVTAFGEDYVAINTFNYNSYGFLNQPVDYYLRPYLMATEQWLNQKPDGNETDEPHCLGFKHSAEHIYDFALEFTQRYSNDSFFGFFWTNTHSHGPWISRPTSMDSYIKTFLERLKRQGTLDHTIMVLLSDHGMRYGPTRFSKSGWLEERLPFLYIWLPPYLREMSPDYVEALQRNGQRLTNPYDLHITLKHFIHLSGRMNTRQMGGAKDCPRCQSLLQVVPLNRSCADVAITDIWCACWIYQSYCKHNESDRLLATHAIKFLNGYSEFENTPLTLNEIHKVFIAKPNKGDDQQISIRRIRFKTNPKSAVYEASIRYNLSSKDILVTAVRHFP